MSNQYCKSHCRACNSHFANDGAFDAHRIFEEGHKDDWDYRTCADLDDDSRFSVKAERGICAVAGRELRHPVRVWTLSKYLEGSNPWAKARG